MTQEQLVARREQLVEKLRELSIGVEQIKGAIALCDEMLATPEEPKEQLVNGEVQSQE